MKEISFGPVSNPDGSPTDLTLAMLAGTGRDPVAFAKSASSPDSGDDTDHGDPDHFDAGHWPTDCDPS